LNRFHPGLVDGLSSADQDREGIMMASPVLRDSAVRKVEAQQLAAGYSPETHGTAEPRKCCAYNQTRQRFLGLDIDAGDFTASSLDDRLSDLSPKSGAGIWLLPFRGIAAACVHIPVDLVYLDSDGVVIDVVESFPIFHISPSKQPAASVLALPSRMIDETGTQAGDQLILCAPEEMKRRLQRPPAAGTASAARTATSLMDAPVRSTPPNLLQWEDRSRQARHDEDRSNSQKPLGKAIAAPEAQQIKPAKSWWQRLLSPEPPMPRKAARETLPGLTAYFWTGGAPVAHDIQDVSPTGLYVVTEERWYPGTVIRMTLTDSTEPTSERSITVNATSVRWGNDGVGLQFVFQDDKNPHCGPTASLDGVNRKQLDQFMQRLRNGKN
jgi:hypothetical protein